MKHPLRNILALALLATVAASPVQAKKVNPITDWRRTLFTSYGQHALVFEAPVGMCFLDESDYLEGSIIAATRNTASSEYRLIGTFGDCMEIAKFQHDYQDAMTTNPSGGGGFSGHLKNHGSIYWINPENGDEVISLPRSEYLNVRQKSFRDDVIKDVTHSDASSSGGKMPMRQGDLTLTALMSAPDQYKFDEVHSTPDGLSLAYQMDTEIEYEKSHEAGVVGTTLIRHIPLEFSFDFSTPAPDKDSKALYAEMDAFMAQQIKLNAQSADQ